MPLCGGKEQGLLFKPKASFFAWNFIMGFYERTLPHFPEAIDKFCAPGGYLASLNRVRLQSELSLGLFR
jgi:hypothetical protein